jgi:hypothetical protein
MDRTASKPTPRAIALTAAVLAVLFAILGVRAQDASSIAAIELGQAGKTPKPLCPKNCLATGTVTGFQVTANGRKSPFTIPSSGHIVAWSATLAEPDPSQTADFNTKFANKRFDTSVARLAILKPKKKSNYKLVKQSPPVELQSTFGGKPIFTLKKPLKVQKGQRVALTLPTWAPLYVNGLDTEDNQWIASREPDACGVADLLDAKPHQKLGSTRRYGCRFSGERLLYKAFFVPDSGK